ncbi:hypothetical protein EDC01DRAFT_116965 [Geopyxis carbonaria]|nr:hypothetical protein EDC01DRAFT_116965 [Geopyxis carbonaria]
MTPPDIWSISPGGGGLPLAAVTAALVAAVCTVCTRNMTCVGSARLGRSGNSKQNCGVTVQDLACDSENQTGVRGQIVQHDERTRIDNYKMLI